MRRVSTLHVRDRHFVIVQNDEGYYLAVEDKYLDAEGKTTKMLTGYEMHASKDLETCIETTTDCVEIDYIKSTGLDAEAAFAKWFEHKYGGATLVFNG